MYFGAPTLQDMDVVGEPVRAKHLSTPGTTFVLSEVPVGWNTTRATSFPPTRNGNRRLCTSLRARR